MTPQVKVCYERLAAIDHDAAEEFLRLLEVADQLSSYVSHLFKGAADLRRQAWAEYRRITGRPKREDAPKKPRGGCK